MSRVATCGIALFLLMPATGADGDLARSMLSAHNAVREKARLTPLVWSNKLADFAQNWATTLLMQGEFQHRPDNPYGENLFDIRGGKISPEKVVREWAGEVKDYDLRRNLCRGVCGHYTQIVWRETRRVGCAVARSSDREVWVCNYDPPGNINRRRPY